MEFSSTAILALFILATHAFLLSSSSSSPDDFLECLTIEFERTNSETNIIYTPQNTSTYAYLLRPPHIRYHSSFLVQPQVIVTPYHESEIVAAIHCSMKLGLQIRVKSGGHDYEGLSHLSQQNPFVIIDMRNFRQIEIDPEEKTAWVQVGATLGELYHTIAQTSKTLAFPAGSCPTVGVGGHFSGGGYGYLARKHSLAADHIINAKLINADGEILDRESMGEDLFWAIRGGGGTSFGIFLAFKVSLITIPETVTVFNVTRTTEQNAMGLVHKWQYIADKVDDRLLLRVFIASTTSPVTQNRTVEVSFTTMFLGGAHDLLPIMQENFPELGLTEEDCIETSWIESVLFFAYREHYPTLDDLLPRDRPPPIYYFKGKSDYVQNPIPLQGLEGIWSFLIEEDELAGELQFSPYGGALSAISESETPFPHRAGNIFMIEYNVEWVTEEDGPRHLDWIRRLHSYMGSYVSKNPRSQYFNYRDLDIGMNNVTGNTSYQQASVWGFKYFGKNFDRLVRVKTEVDPSNFFRNEQSIPPLTNPAFIKSWLLNTA